MPTSGGEPSSSEADQSELFVALVAAVGTDIGLVVNELERELATYSFTSTVVRLSDYLAEQADVDFDELPFDEAVWEAMTAGDRLRRRSGRGDALALWAVSEIVAERDSSAGDLDENELAPNLERHAFILRSLKTPDELETLRAIYGSRLVVIAAYSPDESRRAYLGEEIARTRHDVNRSNWLHTPDALMARDEKEELAGGQDVSDTFHRADFFIRAWDRAVIRKDVERMLEVLFGAPFRTPTRDEQGQFLAAGAARRSAEFGRQVGAALVADDGALLSLGTNEVPAPGGGSCWEEDGAGNRDFEIGDVDTNRAEFDALARSLGRALEAEVIRVRAELAASGGDVSLIKTLLDELRPSFVPSLRAGGLKDLTEFGRAVHAEMNGLLDAARRGVSVEGATLHSTTYPCHNCARHLIGAGVKRVVFIEPYPKSRALRLHSDALDDGQSGGIGTSFEPFVGVAPRRFLELFDAAERERTGHVARKSKSGVKNDFVRRDALPIFRDTGLPKFRVEFREYRWREIVALDNYLRDERVPSDESAILVRSQESTRRMRQWPRESKGRSRLSALLSRLNRGTPR